MAANQVDVLHTGMGIDTRDWASFTKALRKGAPDIAKQLKIGLRVAGQIVADKAEEIIDPFSSVIGPSIKVRVAGAGVSVVAGGGSASPLAGLFEQGNKGRGGSDTFRHPVFGNKNIWVTQPTHPFLAPALLEKLADVEVAVTAALDQAIAGVVE